MENTIKSCNCKYEKQCSGCCNADESMKSRGSRGNDRPDNSGSNDEMGSDSDLD